MKAAIKTIDGILVKRKRRISSSQKQNLCLAKGYNFQEIEHESIIAGSLYSSVYLAAISKASELLPIPGNPSMANGPSFIFDKMLSSNITPKSERLIYSTSLSCVVA